MIKPHGSETLNPLFVADDAEREALLKEAADGSLRAEARVDAKNAQISVESLAWVKPTGRETLIDFEIVDMTTVPTTWGRFMVSLAIDESLEGQILQFGFLNTASDFEGSGVFYDNVRVDLE